MYKKMEINISDTDPLDLQNNILRITIHNNIGRLFANKTKNKIRSHLSCKFPCPTIVLSIEFQKQLKFVGEFLLFIFFNSSYTTVFVDAQSYFKINVNVLSIVSTPILSTAPSTCSRKYKFKC